MQRQISSRLAVEIILFLAILVGWFAITKSDSAENFCTMEKNAAIPVKIKTKDSCKIHAYKGKATIRGWLTTSSDGEQVFVVSDEDLKSLPEYKETEEYKTKNKQIKLVDMTSALKKKLQKTSEQKPQTVTITGFATRCKGTPLSLASIEYENGIFRKYLDM